MSEAFPEEWEGEMGKVRVIWLLQATPLTWRQRKAALYEWCSEHDVELSANDVVRVTGRPAGEV